MLATIYPEKPREALAREQAVIAYTLTAAYSEFAELELVSHPCLVPAVFPLVPGFCTEAAIRLLRFSAQAQ